MESTSADIRRVDSLRDSFRSGSSSIWRNSGAEVFARSSRQEDDEEAALKWAALERLPTFDRLRKGILPTSKGGVNVVDICDLGLAENVHLLEKLMKASDEDNEKFLLKLRSRIDRVGIELPTIEVRFEHLKVEAKAYEGSRALPTIPNFFSNMLEGFLPSRKKQRIILKDISGIIKPSGMTLLLGPPNAGKTTLLLALAGKLDPTLQCSGRVTYNGHMMSEFVPQRTAQYISQHDNHIAEMTVRETLTFSARCQGVGFRHEMLMELLRREREANIKPDPEIDVFMKAAAMEGHEANAVTEYVLKLLGLEVCADIMVGNHMIRGISGGQKRRLTTGEMLVGPVMALFMDEISTGLDSSTTFQIVNYLKQYIHIFNGTAVISLLQPAPETYDLFDDIIILSDGQIVYQGPRESVLEFFEHMGFRCPKRKGVADFLQEVTSVKDQEQYWACKDQPYRFITVNDFAEAFQLFNVGQSIADELAIPFDKAKNHPAALTTKKYGVGTLDLLRASFSREYLLMKRKSFLYFSKFCQAIMLTTISMTVFLRTNMHKDTVTDGVIYAGALFFTAIMFMFTAIPEVAITIEKLPVFYKQRDLLFYPSWAYSLPPWILKIPLSCIEVAAWVFISYYAIGYDPDVERLFKQYFLVLLLSEMATSLCRFVAAVGRNMIVSNTYGSFVLLALFTLGGYILSREKIKKWWIWAYWLSPLMYGQNALVVNEFLGNSWNHIPKNSNSTEPLGIQVLMSRGFFTEAYWYWIGVGAMAGFVLLFNGCFALALSFLNRKSITFFITPLQGIMLIYYRLCWAAYEKTQAILPKDSEIDESRCKRRGTIELSNCGSNHRINTESGDDIIRSGFQATGESSNSRKKGMVLPFEPLCITFDDVIYSIDMPQVMKAQGIVEDRFVLLNCVSGAFQPGILTALMGISGAGKTTLMDVLAGRKTGGYIEGDIRISGYPKKQETFARISGYCEQNDIHSPNVTVFESLLFSAWLRLPREVDSVTRKMFIEEVMELVELNPLRQALVGLPGVSGLSTEQRKRLTIAVELVANPSIIFMDEPTSGLDARAAAIVMRTVRNTVDTGRTVVCTIHQPSIDIFEAFDKLFLMKQGGQEIYVGPLGHHSALLIRYFEEIEGVCKIKDGYNPATWMLEVTTSEQERALGVDFADIYRNSDLYRQNKALIVDLSKPAPGSKDLYFPTRFSTPFFTQCIACLWKQHWSYWRNPPYNAVRFIFTTVIALMFGTMFWDLGSNTENPQDIFNAMGSMYAAVLFLGMLNTISVQPVVDVERTVFYRERAAGMYSAFPYAFAQVLIELPYIFAQATIYGVIVYGMMQFDWTIAKFFWYLFFTYFSFLYFTFFGMMAMALAPNQDIAAIITSAFVAPWNLFSGFIIPRNRIPVWWRWCYWVSPMSWTLNGLITSQYGDISKRLANGLTMQEFLKSYFGFRHDFLGEVAAVVLLWTIVFACTFAFSIKALNFERR